MAEIAQERLRAVAEGRRRPRRLEALPRGRVRRRRRRRTQSRRRGNERGGQGANDLRELPGEIGAAKLALLQEAAGWADERRGDAPKDANAHYLYAYSLGRYSQGISITKALAQGFGGKIKDALTTALKLEAKHADAHTAFGSYQAEIIDKVGGIVAGMTYGAKKDSALEHFQKALKLNPDSAIARIEYANGLIMLFGKTRMAEAEKLYKEAAACTPADAMERLDVELARSELE
jgi:tetratricopeptide (TPR) repeat protein